MCVLRGVSAEEIGNDNGQGVVTELCHSVSREVNGWVNRTFQRNDGVWRIIKVYGIGFLLVRMNFIIFYFFSVITNKVC